MWAYYIRCCLQGNVVLVVTVCQGKQTNETTRHRRISSKKGSESKLGSGAKVDENPEASVDSHVTSHSDVCMKSKPMSACDARRGKVKLLMGKGRDLYHVFTANNLEVKFGSFEATRMEDRKLLR